MNNLPEKLQKIVKEVDQQIAPKLAEIEDQIVFNQAKVLKHLQYQKLGHKSDQACHGPYRHHHSP